MKTAETLLPPGWQRPKGYSNGIVASGKTIFTAGIIGWNEHEELVHSDMVNQFRQVLLNTLAILKEAGADASHVVRMTWYITDRDEYIAHPKDIGSIYRELMGSHYPVMAVVQVISLMEVKAKIEIETTAVISD